MNIIMRRQRRRDRYNVMHHRKNREPDRPLHTLELLPNPQSASLLYNGRIPPEIRDQIFGYALTEYTKTDPESQYPPSTNYTRPGYTGKRTITIALLQTCKRIYLETYHLPPVSKEHVFWHKTWPNEYAISGRYGTEQEQDYFAQFHTWQLELVKEIHIFAQQCWLEDAMVYLSKQDFLQKIEKVTITIRRGDWWWNERNAPLGINPQRGDAAADQMLKDWRSRSPVPWREDEWGCAFRNMWGLKELELELETSEDKVEELKEIVKHAKGWKFPMGEGMCLSAEGLEPKTSVWRSTEIYWAESCPYCNTWRKCRGSSAVSKASLKKECAEKLELKKQGLGPLCSIMSLRFKLAQLE